MPPLQGFSHGFYDGRSRRFDSQRLENFYVEPQESGSGQSPAVLLGAPGLKLLTTLPTQPLRGLWAGDGRAFAVSGGKLYEVFLRSGALNTNGTAARWISGPVFDASMVNSYLTIGNLTYQVMAVNPDKKQLTLNLPAGVQFGVPYEGECTFGLRGTVGDDDEHTPVRMFSNGNELFMAASDQGYVATGSIAAGTATISLAGTSLSRNTGDFFSVDMIGQVVTVGGEDFEIASFTSTSVVGVTKAATAARTAAPYNVWSVQQAQFSNGEGTVTTVATGNAVVWASGNKFTQDMAGNPIFINGVKYIVASVTDATHLTLTTSAGTQTFPAYSVALGLSGIATAAPVGFPRRIVWVSGGVFTAGMAGQKITLGGKDYTVDPVAANSAPPTSVTVTEDIANEITIGPYTIDIAGLVTVDSTGLLVTWTSGDKFDNLTSAFTVSGVKSQVLTWTDATHVTLLTPVPSGTLLEYTASLSERNSIISIAGTAVTWVSGDQFPPALAGRSFVADDQTYKVLTWNSNTSLTLEAALQMSFDAGLPPQTGTCTTSGTTVTQQTGPAFTDALVGLDFTIGDKSYVVAQINTPATTLLLETSAGTQMAPKYIATSPLKARQGSYIDRKFIAQIADTNEIRFSAIGTAVTPWDPLDAGIKETAPDRLLAIWADSGALNVMGYETGEVWRDTGSGPAAGFERDPSGTMQQGISAPWSMASLEKGPVWIGEDIRGRGIAWQMRGLVPQRISTHAIEAQWQTYGTTQDAEGYSMQEGGHNFWVIHFPSGNATWAYDETANIWAERTAQYPNGVGKLTTAGTAATWVSGAPFTPDMVGHLITLDGVDNWVASYTTNHAIVLGLDAGTQTGVDFTAWMPGRQIQRCHAFAFQRHLVGDWRNGNIYEQSPELLDDDGAPILRERTCPHVSQEQLAIYFHRLQLEMEVGGGGNTYTDLFIDSAQNKNFGSALQPFNNRDIGRYLNITGGAGFTVQRIRIVTVNGQGIATSSKPLGTLSATGGQAATDDPQVWLELSRDGGKTYGPIHTRTAGLYAQFVRRVIWNRLGFSRDRVFRIRSTARIQHAWLAADLLATPGTS